MKTATANPAAGRRRRAIARPFVFINMSMTADGKIASTNRRVVSFGSKRDLTHLYELRATADAVMSGARTLEMNQAVLGPGGVRFQKARKKRGLAEFNLRIVVSGRGTIDPEAPVFQRRISPVILLTTARAGAGRISALQSVADEVRVCGRNRIDWPATLHWLRTRWKIRRLLCEGGAELNGELIRAGLVDEIHLTICPLILGGREAPTIAAGPELETLAGAAQFRCVSARSVGKELFAVLRRA